MIQIAIPTESRDHETRVACTPDVAAQYVQAGAQVIVQAGAGRAAGFLDDQYAAAGATLVEQEKDALAAAPVVLKVQRPTPDEVSVMQSGAKLFCLMNPSEDQVLLSACELRAVDAFALELMPRITRAQTMDVLSSQTNLAGYRAVIEAAAVYERVLPMMMTAAGSIAPARVFVMGAGVAGLQAIATARRLGAVVTATDVRPAAKEQVESLGASFVAVEDEEFQSAETAGGYAKAMSPEYQAKQAQLVREHVQKQDIVITAALTAGRGAPKLLDEAMVRSMRPGSVVVDIAVEQGGNCELSQPNEVVDVEGVKVVGYMNLAGRVAADASALYARNLYNFLSPMIDAEHDELQVDWSDEIVLTTNLTRAGKIVHPDYAAADGEGG